MIKKILFCAVFTMGFTSMAFSLSSEEVAKCKSYMELYGSGKSQIVSADTAKEVSDTLAICYQSDICQNELRTMSNCTKKLTLWEINPPVAEKKSTSKQRTQKKKINKPIAPSISPDKTTQQTQPETHSIEPFNFNKSTEKTTQSPQLKKETKKNDTQPINWF